MLIDDGCLVSLIRTEYDKVDGIDNGRHPKLPWSWMLYWIAYDILTHKIGVEKLLVKRLPRLWKLTMVWRRSKTIIIRRFLVQMKQGFTTIHQGENNNQNNMLICYVYKVMHNKLKICVSWRFLRWGFPEMLYSHITGFYKHIYFSLNTAEWYMYIWSWIF